MATPMFRFDPVELPPEALAMRAEVRDFIKEHRHLMGFFKSSFSRDFSRAMGKRGWIGRNNMAATNAAPSNVTW